ncbi:MAG: family 10 glycosylhydrolase [Phycisphaerales bacterium]|nr:family 10 glycosylhydrolase [Planctomycetota bacterium]MCH8508335.1 family 10 glycosylhydrolase [Phycisphaerales bacterium]
MLHRSVKLLAMACLGWGMAGCVSPAQGGVPEATSAPAEVRGVWLTTTANDHIASPGQTAETMRRLREMGLNTVYVEAWKNGYTQYPSAVLERVIGVDRRPALIKQDPGDPDKPIEARDLLGETTIEAHRNGLLMIGWFEYGFMAAHKDTENHLREMYPHWLSRDQEGNEVAPNGFVWMNPLHPETRRFLLDIILEAVDRYDLDGVQLDDRIVWPYYTMGYDDFTVAWYRNDHGGKAPPQDPKDPAWMRWRADKVNEYARQFVKELRQARPGLIVSLSPAPYPWCWENYLLEWPKWAAWEPGNSEGMWWDEFIPQAYRYDWPAFKATWDQQIGNLHQYGAGDRVKDMLAGVLTTGSRPDPVPWADLEQKIDYVRSTKAGGHVWWFSRGVLDVYPRQIEALYDVAGNGHAPHPMRPDGWRTPSIPLQRRGSAGWAARDVPAGRYRVIARGSEGSGWSEFDQIEHRGGLLRIDGSDSYEAVELLIDRRQDMSVFPPGS